MYDNEGNKINMKFDKGRLFTDDDYKDTSACIYLLIFEKKE